MVHGFRKGPGTTIPVLTTEGWWRMNKWMAIIVLIAAVPAIGAVNFTVSHDWMGRLTIAYTTTDGDLPRGVALKVSLSDGVVVDTSPWNFPIAVVDPAFNTFPDYAYSYPLNYAVGAGHPLAKANEAGALTTDASDFSICMGVLDQTGAQKAGPASSTNLITLTLKMGATYAYQTTVTITGDTLRGPASGVVGGVMTSNLPQTLVINNGPWCDYTGPDWEEADAVGCPASWMGLRQCHGDADNATETIGKGTFWVGYNDINILLAGFKKAQ
jgi:hypothetical protein